MVAKKRESVTFAREGVDDLLLEALLALGEALVLHAAGKRSEYAVC